MRGLVTKSTGSWYLVLGDDGRRYECRIKGKFRTHGIKSTNPVAVGDWVEFDLEPDLDSGVIRHLEPRRNYIIRRSVNLSKQTQIIGANLDQALLVVTLASPPTSLGFIDRFLVTAEAYSVPAMLVFNKLDLFSDEGLDILKEYEQIYESIGYPCYKVSALEGINVEELKDLLKDKVTLVSGHSGVGKSTLINALIPEAGLKTGSISDWSDKGKHTTTFAEMMDLPFGGKLIDTPGIRELGIVDIEPQELSHFFPEMRALLNKCRFNNCRHVNEPGCAVMEAVENGAIEASRYDSYLSIYHNENTRN
ncbi:ribosome small subunit-dependent GTPase A [Sphingobacterium spiritivorum]|uniref:Small ribosomal subunit biogenesis GTPase RsgA n=1 Tax=Sphingobacterium spiritivorum ATCC 33861 TaxID=525373 RepID=D7VLP6_SPHSI|nr:ribosome small subunit-dependent GTPase A [Sphingobacterium spiritivorum]EFK58519.1 ribosome small subunit-dependent GTPase A [Sphingobacterium spiritivorum ATCC 33861]QQT37253.1 ribosome small subunit-dependent GTPase A [Sphingobacterium spiritivorum]WQD34035.1 ribosome small subunit-dependent GTPase A [Sphingobacterium spiritivorum]SUJ29292.1 Putative ribosome biogenesis GTPase RsgA [Sphingobacterium spiritivorum]